MWNFKFMIDSRNNERKEILYQDKNRKLLD